MLLKGELVERAQMCWYLGKVVGGHVTWRPEVSGSQNAHFVSSEELAIPPEWGFRIRNCELKFSGLFYALQLLPMASPRWKKSDKFS